jgi:hypothetical protein
MHVFDIETGPDLVRAKVVMPAFDEAGVKMGNLKDPEKRAGKIEEARANHESDWLKDAALRPETGQVLAIGVIVSGNTEQIFHLHERNEEQSLNAFWKFFEEKRHDSNLWVGHNIFEFDLPFLVLRSRVLGIPVPDRLRYGRYFSQDLFLDTLEEWKLRRRNNCKSSLDYVAKSLGCGSKNGNGGEFATLYERDEAEALAYLRSDLVMTKNVAVKLGIS